MWTTDADGNVRVDDVVVIYDPASEDTAIYLNGSLYYAQRHLTAGGLAACLPSEDLYAYRFTSKVCTEGQSVSVKIAGWPVELSGLNQLPQTPATEEFKAEYRKLIREPEAR